MLVVNKLMFFLYLYSLWTIQSTSIFYVIGKYLFFALEVYTNYMIQS